MTEVTGADIKAAFGKLIRDTAALIIAIGVLASAGWYAFEPRIDDWLEEKFISLANINTQPKFMEFRGNGVVVPKGPFKPGSRVPILYLLKRNLPCSTKVEVRFISAKIQNVDTSYTYIIPATQSPISRTFNYVTINVKLPDDLPAGRWSYAPVLIPENCVGYNPEYVPVSEFFNVE